MAKKQRRRNGGAASPVILFHGSLMAFTRMIFPLQSLQAQTEYLHMLNPKKATAWMTRATYGALGIGILSAFVPESFILIPTAHSLESANRMVNALFAGMITGLAFLLTLSAQLYTPRLVGLIVRNPLIIATMLFLFVANLTIMLQASWPQSSPYYTNILIAASSISMLTLFISIPVLTFMTNFLRPDYFLPQIMRSSESSMQQLAKGNLQRKHYVHVIESWDVITNIALTAIQRDDRQLIRLAMKMLDNSLHRIVTKYEALDAPWREGFAYFAPGMTSDSSSYLRQTKTWPEAYLLLKKEQILRSTNYTQNDVVSDSCKNVHRILAIAEERQLSHILELNLMFMNSLMRSAISGNNIELFQLLSYHYRVNAILIRNDMQHRRKIFSSWTYYARTARKAHLNFAFETVLYDFGFVLITIAREDENLALFIYDQNIAPFVKNAKELEPTIGKVAWRVSVKTYWEATINGCNRLAEEIMQRFLKSNQKHYEIFVEMNRFNSQLNWELGDRLMSYTYFSEEAYAQAQLFFTEKGFIS
ncbi:MAG: hypothetical protein OXT67_11150 [Zetaproteobacteria bacterium]|nr:hypothetical protein [Zetaproteobacteria bacterium]